MSAPSAALVLETLGWLDTFRDDCLAEVDQVQRAILRAAMLRWAGRQLEGEQPPPLDVGKPLPKGICAWCFDMVKGPWREFGGARGHPECVRYVYRCVAGDDAPPWPLPDPSVYESVDFLQRLGREAARLGIDLDRLATAISRASRHG